MKEPMLLEEVMALDPDNKNKDLSDVKESVLDAQGILDLTDKILHNTDEALHGELDPDKHADRKELLTTAGGEKLWGAYNRVLNNQVDGIKDVEVVALIHDHFGEQGHLHKWT